MLEGDGEILDVARDVTRILNEERIRGAAIGGIAAGLHGHVRATADVIALIRARKLDGAFALCVSPALRGDFRKLFKVFPAEKQERG